MRAEIQPLRGKYYGTLVKVFIEGSGYETFLTVWYAGDYTPSQRQMEEWGVSSLAEADEQDCRCDTHFETAISYEIARRIAAACTDPEA